MWARGPLRGLWKRFRSFLETVAGMDDTPHQLALGLGIGVFVGFLPCMGVQTWVALPIAWATGGNRALAMAGVWISNPVTFFPFYYVCYRFGLILYQPDAPLSLEQFRALLSGDAWAKMLEIGKALVVPLTLGGFGLGIPIGILTYFALLVYLERRRAGTSGEAGSGIGRAEG
jgi:uncharacterized protein (DUF2062 family)